MLFIKIGKKPLLNILFSKPTLYNDESVTQ